MKIGHCRPCLTGNEKWYVLNKVHTVQNAIFLTDKTYSVCKLMWCNMCHSILAAALVHANDPQQKMLFRLHRRPLLAVANNHDRRPVTEYFAKKKKCRAIAEDALFNSGRCASDRYSMTADILGLQLYAVQKFLALSCCSFDCMREGEKYLSFKKEKRNR